MQPIEREVNGKPLIFTGKSVNYAGHEFFYSRMSNIAHRSGEQPAYLFDYEGKRLALPYDPKDKEATLKIFQQIAAMEKKRKEETPSQESPKEEPVNFAESEFALASENQPVQMQKKRFYKRIWFWVILAVLILAVSVWFIQVRIPYNAAVKDYNTAAERVKQKNDELDKAIKAGQEAVESEEAALDNSIRKELSSEITNAEKVKREVGDAPNKKDEVISTTKLLNEPLDYSDRIAAIEKKTKALQDSFKQYKQLTNPKEAFVIERLKTVKAIQDMQAVTENHDMNKLLNKPGGYTACIYFLSPLVNQSSIYGKTILDKGTDCGGAIEVYKNVSEAKKRDEYLSTFDANGLMDPGSHMVAGTVVIRTSRHLTASQQKKLEKQVYNALKKL